MAGDWIKMRVWLARDPRVISMADRLAANRSFMNWLTDPVQQSCRESAFEHVTRNVIVALCVTGLLVTWGTAREQGDRDGDDLILHHADLSTLDAMTDIPGFGDAMAFVDWIEYLDSGALMFPKFFRENESPDEKHKRQAAERQARFREKQSRDGNVKVTQQRNVTVTHREEKRREEVKHSRAPHSALNGAFANFWQAYPKKKSKGDAEKAWLSIKPDERLTEQILSSVERAKTSADWRKNGGQFIPHPATWLRARGWEDQLSLGTVAPGERDSEGEIRVAI